MSNYEKKYKEALARAKTLIEKLESNHIKGFIYDIFPELKESDDERIRKGIIRNLEYLMDRAEGFVKDELKERIAWLEKQKEFVSADFDDVWETADCEELTAPLEKYSKDAIKKMCHAWYDKGIELERRNWLEKQGENHDDKYNITGIKSKHAEGKLGEMIKEIKSADKVEPKFHEGDWIVHHGTENIYQVVAVIDNQYQLKYGDNYTVQNCADVDRCARLWDITKDVKDGDVLQLGKVTAIFQDYISNKECRCYCSVFEGEFKIPIQYADTYGCHNAIPATKEQRDKLEKAMADAGYTFDFEKKELKKIEQKPDTQHSTEWSVSDFRTWQYIVSDVLTKKDGIGQYLDSCECKKIAKYMQEEWSKKLSTEQNSTWSEGDELHIRELESLVKQVWVTAEHENDKDTIHKMSDLSFFLKTLKPQPKQEWSEEDEKQARQIERIVHDDGCTQKLQKQIADWLKSIKERYSWKPSDEQMIALNDVITNGHLSNANERILKSLQEQLKKLK